MQRFFTAVEEKSLGEQIVTKGAISLVLIVATVVSAAQRRATSAHSLRSCAK
jgi:hypothetical protein